MAETVEVFDDIQSLDLVGDWSSLLGKGKLDSFILGPVFAVSLAVKDSVCGEVSVDLEVNANLLDFSSSEDDIYIQQEATVSDQCSSFEYSTVDAVLSFVDQILSEDAITLTTNIQITESGSLVEEYISLSVTCSVSDIGQSDGVVETSIELDLTDEGNFEDSLEIVGNILEEDFGYASDSVGLTGQSVITDSGQFSDAVSTLKESIVTDSGSFEDILKLTSSFLEVDSGYALDSAEIASYIDCTDVVGTLENVSSTHVCIILDSSDSEDDTYIQRGATIVDSGKGVSVVSWSIYAMPGDSGQFTEASGMTGSLLVSDTLEGITVVRRGLYSYHKIDKTVWVDHVGNAINIKSIGRNIVIK